MARNNIAKKRAQPNALPLVKNLSEKKNLFHADLIRIIAAFFVIFSHTSDRFVLYTNLKDSFAWNIMYYFNSLSHVAVPLFVMLSGYLLLNKKKTEDKKYFYTRRFSRILLPFIFWTVIYFLSDQDWTISHLTLDYVLQRLWHGDIWHLYFIIIILELYLIAPFLSSFAHSLTAKKQAILFWSLLAFSIFWSLVDVIGVDIRRYALTMFIPYIGFFYAGSYLRDKIISRKNCLLLIALYFILPIIANLIAKGDIGSFIVKYYSPILLPMTICLFLFFKNLDQFINENSIPQDVQRATGFVASCTFGIFFIHALVLERVFVYLHLYPWQIHAPLVFFGCLPVFITFIISLILIAILRKIPYVKYISG